MTQNARKSGDLGESLKLSGKMKKAKKLNESEVLVE
jgi:hypothetical protein